MTNSNSPDQELLAAITKHTEQALADKEDAALKGFPYQVLFAADDKDNVKITIRWPQDSPKPRSVKTISTMLQHIGSGNWAIPTASSLKKAGEECGQEDVARQILNQWGSTLQPVATEQSCVLPRNVFTRTQGRPQ
jgi:hypothetical protein